MPNIALKDPTRRNQLEPERSLEQDSYILGEVFTKPGPAYVDPVTGRLRRGDASVAGTAAVRGFVWKPGLAGDGRTLYRKALADGYDVDALPFDAPLYLSDDAGEISDTPGTVAVIVARVVPAKIESRGQVPAKLVRWDL